MKFRVTADLEKVFDTLSKAKLCYVALPYQDFPQGVDRAWTAACRSVAALEAAGIQAVSPIVHWHPISKINKSTSIPPARARAIVRLFEQCDAVVVLTMEGWRGSDSLLETIKRAEFHMKPVFYLPVPEELAGPVIAQEA